MSKSESREVLREKIAFLESKIQALNLEINYLTEQNAKQENELKVMYL